MCLMELGRTSEVAAELDRCQKFLSQSELYGPLELLGVLIARAVLIAEQDPQGALDLLARVEAQRGRWVLPFGLDADREALASRLTDARANPPVVCDG